MRIFRFEVRKFEVDQLGFLEIFFERMSVDWYKLLDDNYEVYQRMRVVFFKVNTSKLRIDELEWIKSKKYEKLMALMKRKLIHYQK
jgi:hypothetical protein